MGSAFKFNRNVVFAVLFLCIQLLWASQATARNLNDASLAERHQQWMAQYGRVYNDEAEKAKRFEIFKENVEFIESFNKAGTRSYKLAVNKFADLTNEEFKNGRNGYKPSHFCRTTSSQSFRYENVSAVPASMDWRKKGAVTGIKDQGQCGTFFVLPFLYLICL